MKYLLMIYMNPDTWNSLTEEQRDGVMNGHTEFQKTIIGTGEMVSTHALAEQSQSAAVRLRDGVPAVTDGPYLETKEFLAGYYLVECASRERAIEVAALMPEAPYFTIEVRPVVHSQGADL